MFWLIGAEYINSNILQHTLPLHVTTTTTNVINVLNNYNVHAYLVYKILFYHFLWKCGNKSIHINQFNLSEVITSVERWNGVKDKLEVMIEINVHRIQQD